MTRNSCLVVGALAILSALGGRAVAADDILLADGDLTDAYKPRTYAGRGVVHDPSVFIDTISKPAFRTQPRYYIYGSHLATAYTDATSNYAAWTTFGGGETTQSSLFSRYVGGNAIETNNWEQAYSLNRTRQVRDYRGEEKSLVFDAEAWHKAGSTTTVRGNQWAPDVIYNKTLGRWFMYMSLNGDNWASAICAFSSDSPEGRWVYEGPVVMSGFNGANASCPFAKSDVALATGETTLPARYNVGSKWGTYWPNCIDPCVFYDAEDRLWMSYGSWSGGIFMLRLDPSTGLRDYTHTFPYEVSGRETTLSATTAADANCTSDPYFGRKVAGGYYVSGEASYIEKIGDYYFLFMSYGGLTSDGGYQMRLFRSESPTGPYRDPYGTSAIFTSYRLNFGATATDARGMLLMGGYKWDLMPSGELAQGHNSAITDHKGRALLVYHTRFNDGTEGHQVRVRQMLLNDEGWLVTAPFEFSGQTVTSDSIATRASIADEEIAGNYQLMRHRYNQDTGNKAVETPINIALTADGRISGQATGSWSRTPGTDYVNLIVGGVTYRGVLLRQTVDYSNIPALCIAACSSSSGAVTIGRNTFTRQLEVWAVKADARAAIRYTLDKTLVPFADGATISTRQTLPTKGYLGTTVRWKTSDPTLLTAGGTVSATRTGPVTLTLTIAKDGYLYEKAYNLHVDASGTASVPVFFPESTTQNLTSGWWSNFSTQTYTLEAGGEMEFRFYNYSAAANNWENWCLYGAAAFANGAVTGEYFGLRCDNWDNTTGSNQGCTSDYDWPTFRSEMNGSQVNMTVSYTAAGLFTMKATITGRSGKVYNYAFTRTIDARPARMVLFFVNEKSYITRGDLTGIGSVSIDAQPATATTPAAAYDLHGRRITTPRKGLRVIGGKVVIVK